MMSRPANSPKQAAKTIKSGAGRSKEMSEERQAAANRPLRSRKTLRGTGCGGSRQHPQSLTSSVLGRRLVRATKRSPHATAVPPRARPAVEISAAASSNSPALKARSTDIRFGKDRAAPRRSFQTPLTARLAAAVSRRQLPISAAVSPMRSPQPIVTASGPAPGKSEYAPRQLGSQLQSTQGRARSNLLMLPSI